MKKTILTLLLFLFAMAMTKAQSVNFTIAPVVCYNGSGSTVAYASITQTAGPATYSWSVVSASSPSCNANYSSASPGFFATFFFNCCGMYTVTCIPSIGPSVSHTMNVVCPTPIVIAPTPSVICPGDSLTLVASGAGSYTWSTGQVGNSIHVSPTSTTCYTVTTNNSGCYSSASRCIFVSPSNISISGPNSVCPGGTVALTATGATSLVWQPGGFTGPSVIVSPSVSTCYSVTGLNACNGIVSAVKCITVQPFGNVTIMGQDSLCSGSQGFLVASGANSYTWMPGGFTGSVISISPTVTTCYTVTGSNGGCGISAAAKCVHVNNNGNITISGPSTACPNNTLVLTASGASNYTWQPGNITGPNGYFFPSPGVNCYTVIGHSNCNGGLVFAVKCVTVGSGSNVAINGPNSVCTGDSITLVASGGTSYTWQPGNVTGPFYHAGPVFSTTCYTVNASGSCGISAAAKCVSVTSSNNIAITGPGTICAGTSATLTATGIYSVSWQPGGFTGNTIVVSPSVTTCYTVTGISNCGNGLFTTSKCIVVQPSGGITITGPNSICAGTSATLTAVGGFSVSWQPGGFFGNSIVVSPSVTTCYTATGISSCGSGVVSVVKCVTVNQGPVITTTNPGAICAGNNATLTASGAITYTWQPYNLHTSTIIITPSVSTCYSVAGTNSLGCSGFASYGCFSVVPGPTVTIASSASVICAGANVTLTASGANSYTWSNGATGASIVVSPGVSTCYTVAGSYFGGCVSYATRCVIVQSSNLIVSGPNSICGGSTATLVASDAASYTWQPGNLFGAAIAVSPSVNTCYTVSGYDPTCGTIKFGVKCITVGNNTPLTVSGPSVICAGSSATLIASGAASYTWQPGNLFGAGIVVTPTATTCYTVSGYDSICGGIKYGVKCISVGGNSTLSISGPNSICAGGSATLVASGAASYTWQPGNLFGAGIVVTPTANTCYTVSGYNPTCGTINYGVKCITVGGSVLPVSGPSVICAGSSATLVASGAASYTWQPGNLFGAGIVVTPSATTCYTVSGYDSICGIIKSGIKCISVGGGGSAISISGPSVICSGNSAMLTATGATSLIWQPGNLFGTSIVVSPTATTCYTVTGYNTLCGGISSGVKCIVVQAPPVLTTSGSSVICQGSTAFLSAGGATTYTWLPGNLTGSFVSVTPSVTTCYTVVGTGPNGCIGVNSRCVVVGSGSVLNVSGPGVICAGSTATLVASGAASYTWQPGNLFGAAIAVSPSVNTCYTVSGYNPNCGTINYGVKCITVGNNSPLTVSGPSVICAGSSATLVASGAGSYTWQPGNLFGAGIVVTPTATTCYTVSGYDTICGGIKYGVKCITVGSNSTLSISGPNSICAGSSATLVASGAASYTWQPGNLFGAGIVVTPTANTCYTVSGYNPTCGTINYGVKCITVSGSALTVSGPSVVCAGSSATLVASGAASYTWQPGNLFGAGIVVTPTATTCYTVSGYNPTCGTIISGVKCIVVSAVSLSLSPNQTTCQGNMVSLVASGASTYLWSNGSTSNAIFVSPAVSTVYTVTGYVGNCSQTRTVAVFVNPNPVITLASSSPFICAGNSATLTASGALTYTWNPGGLTGSAIVITPSVTTHYIVNGTNSFGCVGTMTLMQTVSPCTGIDAVAQKGGGIFVYPNPASSFITLQTEVAGTVNYFVCDMIGREIVNGSFTEKKDLDLSMYANGTYIIRFESASGTMYKKLVIEK